MAQPLINGQAYAWADIALTILGVDVSGVKSIKYTEEQEMQNNYGAGNRPVSRGLGRITTEGSIELQMEEIEAIQAAVATRRLQDIPEFSIIVSFLPAGGAVVTHTLNNCRFMNNGREVGEGDMEIATEINLIISHITW